MKIIRHRELLAVLTLRELRTKYRRTFLGWTWSMLNPLATVAIYSFVFGIVFNAQAPSGANSHLQGFAWFLLAALLPWNFFALINNLGLSSVSSNASLVRRVAFPRETLVFANVLHAGVQFSIEIGLLCVIFLIMGSPILPWLPIVVLTGVLVGIFGAGFALVLSALAVYFRDLAYLWGIVIQVWFFATPIVYPASLIEAEAAGWLATILKGNPMKLAVSVFRDCLYHAQAPNWAGLGVFAACAVASLTGGWWMFLRLSRRLPEEV